MAYGKKKQYRRKLYNAPYKKRSYRRAARSRRPKGLFAKRVRKVIERTAEQKCANYFYAGKELYNTNSASFQNQVLILTADSTTNGSYQIQQGTFQGQRIGNKVTTKKVSLKGTVLVNTVYDATTNYNPCPMYITMWIIKLKPHLTDEVATLDTVVQQSFFQQGNTSTGFAGTIVDMQKTVNQNHVTLLKKRVFKVGMAEVVSSSGNNVNNTIQQKFMNNDASMARMFSMDITKCIPKVQAFNDGTNITVARRTYMFFSACRLDGGAIVTSIGAVTGPIPAYLNLGLQYNYTDV